MEFTGRVYYDFVSRDVFRFYVLLVEAQREGAQLGLEWRALPESESAADRPALAAAELIRSEVPRLHGGYVQAVLAAAHLDGSSFEEESFVPVAARAAGIDLAIVDPAELASNGSRLLTETIAEATRLGVTGVPTLYRDGPAVRIKTTPAVNTGPAMRRLELINAMLEDDGVWELAKP